MALSIYQVSWSCPKWHMLTWTFTETDEDWTCARAAISDKSDINGIGRAQRLWATARCLREHWLATSSRVTADGAEPWVNYQQRTSNRSSRRPWRWSLTSARRVWLSNWCTSWTSASRFCRALISAAIAPSCAECFHGSMELIQKWGTLSCRTKTAFGQW